MQAANPDFRIDDWIVRTQRCCIERGGEERRVKPKAMQVLEQLARARGAVVSRNDLFDTVWRGHAVTDDVLTNCVVELRKAFDDSPKNPRVIETIPKRGFRIVSDVSPVVDEPRKNTRYREYGWPTAVVVGIIVLVSLGMAATTLVPRETVTSGPVGKSVAVLPFSDLSPEGDQEYFADGLSEELINRLTQIDGLLVTGSTSSFYFKGRNDDLHTIGEKLSVTHVLAGSVRKSDDKLRVTTQLVDVESGFHLWSQSYDRNFEDIFAIQDDISKSVAAALSITLKVGEIGTIEGGTDNIEAFDAAMQGSAVHKDFTADATLEAMAYYEEATRIDPEFALAWDRLANVYRTAWLTLGEEQATHWASLADTAVANALKFAPGSETIMRTAAYIEVDRGNWDRARYLFEKILALDPPGNPKESGAYLDLLAKTGSIEEALQAKERMRLIDPLHPDLAMYLGHLYLSGGQIENALEELERGYGLEGFKAQISVEGMVAALSSGDEDEIRKWLARAVEHQQPGAMGVHDAMTGLLDDPDAALAWLRRGFESQSIPDYYVIVWGSYYGDDELALAAMRRSPDLWAFWIPLTRELRGTREFRDILESTGLVDYWREYGWNDYCRPLDDADFVCT